ncbi:MFS transporter [Pseudodesulfovibrio sp. F-1]|uniref:MFS transporter n=1 Tax=Pseudodesulfovibrio alkaliphilus TaxID=2661613 RepID=A0A7K1KQY9_9BACT|nr:MFS transporter [Pseudodesulfovibrio alkaliphilus]MUM78503.1 MFS transporter [Pseudodesulfovibrio alkaliphilus]
MRTRLAGKGAVSPYKLFLLAVMYSCQAIPLGFVFCALPVILRGEGESLERIGGLFVLHLPWAFKFLYASWVDRHWIPALGRRRTWIFPLQWIAAALLLVATRYSPEASFDSMFAVMLVLNVVMATNDIAVDGYATDMLEVHERPWGNSIQAGARYVGLFLGGGVMLTLQHAMGWEILCMILAAVVFLLSLPVLFHTEILPTIRPEEGREGDAEGMRAFLRRRDVLWLLPVLLAPTAFAFSGFMLRSSLFVDLGLDSAVIGQLMMRYAVPFGLAGTFATGWMLSRFGPRPVIVAFSLSTVLLAVYSVRLTLAGTASEWVAAVVLTADNILMGGINVWAFTLMMRVCAGRNSGTGFAALSSLFIIFPLVAAPLMGRLGDMFGFAVLYSLLAVLMLCGQLVAVVATRLARGEGGMLTKARLAMAGENK